MRRFLTTLFILVSFLIISSNEVYAEGEFKTDALVSYNVQKNGETNVTHKITLENLFSNFYATSYTLRFENTDISEPQAKENSRSLALNEARDNQITSLQVIFDKSLVGKGKKRTFEISYKTSGLATKTGEVWEITIPRLRDDKEFDIYTVTLSIPTSFGKEAYLSPKPRSETTSAESYFYEFAKESVSKTGINAAYGQFQVFDFTLNYHLENPLARSQTVAIAIPPDTYFQKVFYKVLDPKPENVTQDADGNWLATYLLKPRARFDVKTTGSVQIFSTPRTFSKTSKENLVSNLKETEFWQTNDPEIIKLAKELKTPKAIYDFVSEKLKYDIKRVKPNVERFGARRALENPNNAICMEYTDLFIAIARAAGIPAREVNGFAYTENPEIQPISLVSDVLHAWPEYWDSIRGAWIPIDPTWASTTGGVDYFSKLDLRHFTFVNHGEDATRPYPPGSYKLGPNPQKDVFVSFGELPVGFDNSPKITATTKTFVPFWKNKIEVRIENPGPTALYNLNYSNYFDGKLNASYPIKLILPYSSYETEISIPLSLFATFTPNDVEIYVDNTRVSIPTGKSRLILYNLIVISAIFSLILIYVFIRFKKYKKST